MKTWHYRQPSAISLRYTMMSEDALTDTATLWDRTGARGRRWLADETARLTLRALEAGTTLAAPRQDFAGRTVLLNTPTQLATAAALLELDGLARRVILCPPSLSGDQVADAGRVAGATMVVGQGVAPGVRCVPSLAPDTRPRTAQDARALDRPVRTEWILFTSGSTGAPKLVLHTLASLLAAIPAGEDESTPVFSTFYDIRRYGGLQILLRALVGGGSMLLSGEGERTGDFLARAGRASVTFVSGTPTHWRRALLCPEAALMAPRDVRLSGEVADQSILNALRAAFPAARVCHAFASTEAGVGFSVADGLAGFPADWIGQARGGVDVRTMDGTLHLRSPGAASRYLGDQAPELRRTDGYVDTRDVVDVIGGRAMFAGRRDGVINVGGQKVHPEEVEAAVNGHPRVAMSQARGKRSGITGAVVVVDVVLRAESEATPGTETETEILRTCRGILAAHKVPAMVRFVPALPVGASGKLLRSHG